MILNKTILERLEKLGISEEPEIESFIFGAIERALHEKEGGLIPEILYGAKEVAKFLGCSQRTVFNMLRAGELPESLGTGNRKNYRKSDLLKIREEVQRRKKLFRK